MFISYSSIPKVLIFPGTTADVKHDWHVPAVHKPASEVFSQRHHPAVPYVDKGRAERSSAHQKIDAGKNNLLALELWCSSRDAFGDNYVSGKYATFFCRSKITVVKPTD